MVMFLSLIICRALIEQFPAPMLTVSPDVDAEIAAFSAEVTSPAQFTLRVTAAAALGITAPTATMPAVKTEMIVVVFMVNVLPFLWPRPWSDMTATNREGSFQHEGRRVTIDNAFDDLDVTCFLEGHPW
jgi:membrane protein implicated in regulation of membrane protease activity